MIDDDDLHRTLGQFLLQPELFLNRREGRRPCAIRTAAHGARVERPRYTYGVTQDLESLRYAF